MYSIQDDGKLKIQNNALRHSPRPIRNNWHYFRPTLVYAGHCGTFKLTYTPEEIKALLVSFQYLIKCTV
jgi:hypothetical protein